MFPGHSGSYFVENAQVQKHCFGQQTNIMENDEREIVDAFLSRSKGDSEGRMIGLVESPNCLSMVFQGVGDHTNETKMTSSIHV